MLGAKPVCVPVVEGQKTTRIEYFARRYRAAVTHGALPPGVRIRPTHSLHVRGASTDCRALARPTTWSPRPAGPRTGPAHPATGALLDGVLPDRRRAWRCPDPPRRRPVPRRAPGALPRHRYPPRRPAHRIAARAWRHRPLAEPAPLAAVPLRHRDGHDGAG